MNLIMNSNSTGSPNAKELTDANVTLNIEVCGNQWVIVLIFQGILWLVSMLLFSGKLISKGGSTCWLN